MELSITQEDYLRAMYKLKTSEGKIRVVDIAEQLGLSKSTVSERLQELARQKFVLYSAYTKLDLSKKGYEVGEMLTYRHRIIECFLHKVLKISKERVHEEAHRLEHAFSDEAIEKLADLVGNPEKDPHGTVIPKIKRYDA